MGLPAATASLGVAPGPARASRLSRARTEISFRTEAAIAFIARAPPWLPSYTTPTAIGGLVADMLGFALSAAVIVWLGGVIRVAEKVWVPASAAVKAYSAGIFPSCIASMSLEEK